MAITNPNTRSNTTGAVGIRGQIKAQPCMRASLRSQVFVLGEDETAYLQWGEAITDDIPRTFLVSVKEDDDAIAASNANTQTALVTLFQTGFQVNMLLQDGGAADTTPLITAAGTDVTTAPANTTLEFGYDANGDPDGNPLYYMASGFANGDAIISITRIDGFTEDLHSLVN